MGKGGIRIRRPRFVRFTARERIDAGGKARLSPSKTTFFDACPPFVRINHIFY